MIFAHETYQILSASFRPPEKMLVSEWAERYRVLSPETAAEPGQWSNERTPYLVGVMDAVLDPDIDTVVWQKSAQVGATEGINNLVGYFIDLDPAPMLIVQPTIGMAQGWSKDRLTPMIRDSARLRAKVDRSIGRTGANNILYKQFPGGQINISGANSPSSLASRPVRFVLIDEVDRAPASAGKEGDPIELAIKRATTFWNKTIVLVSTPTIKDLSRIEAAFLEGDQRYFFVPCPHCGEMQRLVWANVDYKSGPPAYVCEYCEKRWTDAQKIKAVRRGEWRATKETTNIASFHISEIYSSWVTFGEMVKAWKKAQGDRERLKVFINTSLGETYEDRSERIEADDIKDRVEQYPAPVPAGALVLVAGIDVQDNRLEGEVVGFGFEDESWSIETFTIYGNPESAAVWKDLDAQLKKKYKHHSGIEMPIACACIDSGGHYTMQVYKFVKPRQRRRVYAVKGANTAGAPIIGRPSRNNKLRVDLFSVGTDTAKQAIYGRLKLTEYGPGYMHFPNTYEDEYFKQLTAEKVVTTFTHGFPKRVWKKMRERNEALDMRVYAMAALAILNPNYRALAKNLEEDKEQEEKPAKTQKPRRTKRRQSSWMKRR